MVPRRKIFILNVLLATFCIATPVLLSVYGQSQRAYSETPVIRNLAEPRDNLAVWKETGVFGRILVHFDRNIHVNHDVDTFITDNDNYIYMGILEDIVRTVYHIIPDRSWEEVREHLESNADASVYGPGFRIAFEGTPLLIMRARDILPLEEKVLVHIDSDEWPGEDWDQIRDLLSRQILRSDVITVSGRTTDGRMQMLRDAIDISGP